jgi:hypothetical protein
LSFAVLLQIEPGYARRTAEGGRPHKRRSRGRHY